MKPAYLFLSSLMLLSLLAGCSSGPPPEQAHATAISPPAKTAPVRASEKEVVSSGVTPTELPSATASPRPTGASTLTPSDTPTANPSPTDTPTFTPIPPTPTVPLPAELLEAMDAIELEIEELRGLDELQPISRSLMTREELGAYLEKQLEDDYPPEEVAADVRVLAAFEFVPPDFDLQGLLLEMYSTQILGLYDDEEEILYVVVDDGPVAGDGLDLMDRLTFAHEYTHGLQDAHFELDTFIDEDSLNDDEILARMSLVEGDATLAMTEYLLAHRDEITLEDMDELQGGGSDGSSAILADAPAIIVETFEFPYSQGSQFVAALLEEGWDAVDAAFSDPPRSTEQILHPDKYFAGDEPQIISLPPLTDTLGSGWHLVEAETLGEFQTRLYLEQRVDRATAALASEGWDADRYALYAKNDSDLLVFATEWDTARDREEFVDVYTVFTEGRYRMTGSPAGQQEIWWETPFETTVVRWGDTSALLILGPDRETVGMALAEIRH